MKRTLTIEGMSCGHCQAAVKKALEAVEGVSHVTVDLAEKRATLTVQDGTVTDAQLSAAVEDAGYEVKAIR